MVNIGQYEHLMNECSRVVFVKWLTDVSTLALSSAMAINRDQITTDPTPVELSLVTSYSTD